MRKERKRGEKFKGRKGCKEMRNLKSSPQLSGAESWVGSQGQEEQEPEKVGELRGESSQTGTRTYRIGVLLLLQEGRELQHPELGAGHAAALPWWCWGC